MLIQLVAERAKRRDSLLQYSQCRLFHPFLRMR